MFTTDWTAVIDAECRAASGEHDRARAEGRDIRYTSEIGAPARADNLGTLTTRAAAYGLQLDNWYGVRIAIDPDELDLAPPSGPRQLAALLRSAGGGHPLKNGEALFSWQDP